MVSHNHYQSRECAEHRYDSTVGRPRMTAVKKAAMALMHESKSDLLFA
jgi:hypothetical protein